ncbi:MAG: biotin carboxylase [Deltaproteobacteria bacterium]|jgi:acetyl-CoA carboxylase biotin carboxylase subunit|nr:biotin carboxylase [Deltaproteobacteria bacterium]
MFRRVAVANRGTVAARIIRALRKLGVESHALCSEADIQCPYAREADGATVIGPAPPKESYLSHEKVIAAALAAKAEAIHPGYGFLAEDAAFARKALEKGLAFIGPSPRFLDIMGDKVAAREAMGRAGLPLGASTGVLSGTLEERAEEAARIGFPLLVKPAGGGGGIGMIPVWERDKLLSALKTAASQAERGFGKSDLYAERLVENPRHVEFQVVAKDGEGVHLFERDCSIQRRRQKIIEEAGAPGIARAELLKMAALSRDILAGMGYDHLATVETLYGEETGFGFLEVNPRLQVEHAVTEEITGADLVVAQLRLASGEKVSDIFPAQPAWESGWAIEARVYAEDSHKFLPSPGPLKVFRPPVMDGVRVETGFAEGGAITPFYDPMIAQVIAKGPDRLAAADLLFEALGAFAIEGLKTNIGFLRSALRHESFLAGKVHANLAAEIIADPHYRPL